MLIDRRRFVRTLGLGAGAAVLGPVAESIFNEAHGQPATRKRLIVLIAGQGLSHEMLFTPPEILALDAKYAAPVLPGTKQYTWPAFLAKLSKYRERMLLVDGLSNVLPRAMHSGGFGALSCVTAAHGASNEVPGPPGGQTIDQFIAQKIGGDRAFRSVSIGIGKPNVVFASARERVEPAVVDPQRLHKMLFATTGVDIGGIKGGLAIRQKALFDVYRADIAKLNGVFRGSEKLKLEHYLASIESMDTRTRALMALPACAAPAAPGVATTPEDQLEALASMATTALICGMTDVVGISAGCSNPHHAFPGYTRALRDAGLADGQKWTDGHSDYTLMKPGMTAVYNFLSGILARMADTLSTVKEGDKTMFDNTVMVMLSDNAENHHAGHERWPLVVVGDAGGSLKADGRFVRYPMAKPGERYAMGDFFCSLAHAMGAPTDDFGKAGADRVRGPLPELMR